MEPIQDYVVNLVTAQSGWLSEVSTLLTAVVAFASVFVACVAVRLSARQIKMHEQHNRRMATPHLSAWNSTDVETRSYCFTLENNGLGPAIIREVCLWVDGVQLQGEGPDLLEAASRRLFGAIPYEQHAEWFIVGEFIPPGKKFNTTTVMLEDHEPAAVMAIAKSRLRLLIRYDSILGNSYVYDSDSWRDLQ
ncbi:hypothetical protein [Pseudomonas sp. BBP2017]|uniref:hypothetical protein n=1 Tax=Pseudomonas sp. BBP2017 TaxID=2109731 RepID=UPI000D1366FC|nr:hypothetical protein [Pseudomonas sp. BBP2017]PSS51672.1 hypothetical protein C6382_17495 [Pseudomonas sp. BBP2017]